MILFSTVLKTAKSAIQCLRIRTGNIHYIYDTIYICIIYIVYIPKCISVCICMHVPMSIFSLCEFTYLLKLICNPQINACDTFIVICGHVESTKNLSCLMCIFYFHTANKCTFCGLISAMFLVQKCSSVQEG